MSNISISQKDLDILNYKLAFIRSRKFNIQNTASQQLIKNTFYDAVLYEITHPTNNMLLTIQRSLFPLENEDKANERIVPKSDDFFLLSLFFECVFEHHTNDLKINLRNKSTFVTLSPIEILLKGFCTLISEDICSTLFFKKNKIENSDAILDSTLSNLDKLKTCFTENKHKKWINDSIKSIKTFSEKKKTIPTTEQKEINHPKKTEITVNPIVETKESIKPFSKWKTGEITDLVLKVSNNEHNLSEKDLAEFVSFIVKNTDRVYRFLDNERKASSFYSLVVQHNLSFVLPNSLKLDNATSLKVSSFLTTKEPTYTTDSLLLSKRFNENTFDRSILLDMFLTSYRENSMRHVEDVFLKEKTPIDDLNYPNQSNNFFFFNKDSHHDLDLLHFFIIENDMNNAYISYNKHQFIFENKKFDFDSLSTKENSYIPIIASNWSFYKNFLINNYTLVLSGFYELSEEQQIIGSHFLSTLEFVNISDSYDVGMFHYKLMSYQLSKDELFSYIKHSFKSNDNKKVFFNKKTADKILIQLSSFYSSVSNQYKFSIFSKVEDAIVLDWLKTLDPYILEVSRLIELPIAESLSLILNNLSEIKHYASYGIRDKINY